MLKKLIFGAGAAYLARKFMGGRSRSSGDFDRRGAMGLGDQRMGRRRGFFGL